jgi:hypothetical protein
VLTLLLLIGQRLWQLLLLVLHQRLPWVLLLRS